MKKILNILIVMLFAIASNTFADDKLYFENFEIEPGEEMVVKIFLDNTEAEYRDIQFELYLPEGITVEKDKDGEFLVETGSRCTNKHTVGFSYIDGHYVCMLYSTSKSPLTGNSGEILSITLKVARTVSSGVLRGSFRNISLSKTNATGPTYNEFPFSIIVNSTNGIKDFFSNDSTEQIYTIYGNPITTPQKGVNIIRYSDGTTKKVLVK